MLAQSLLDNGPGVRTELVIQHICSRIHIIISVVPTYLHHLLCNSASDNVLFSTIQRLIPGIQFKCFRPMSLSRGENPSNAIYHIHKFPHNKFRNWVVYKKQYQNVSNSITRIWYCRTTYGCWTWQKSTGTSAYDA